MSNEKRTAGETAKATIIGDDTGYGVIHEEYVNREAERNCFRRHEITVECWRKMTGRDELRFWKARGICRTYTSIGFCVVGISRRRWGDNVKVLDRWHVVKAGTFYTPVERDMDDIINGRSE